MSQSKSETDNLAREGERAAQRALKESEYKFLEIVRILDEAYYSCTVEGALIEHNRAFNRILGFDIA